MKKILITGANGQLGKCLKDAASGFSDFEFVFVSKEQLNIEDTFQVNDFFIKNKFTHCINAAAYTLVDQAENEKQKAFAINAEAVENLAKICQENNVCLLHISTDYVFDGKKRTPYQETDTTSPINVYGASKLKGEEYIQENCRKHFIFRTSWLYSQYGHNFLKTILRYSSEGKQLTITTEQTGAPTNANDLAEALLQTIAQDSTHYGVYHFSNGGQTTWFGFAEEILRQTGRLKKAKLAKTDHYKTLAARPEYSVLDNGKAQDNLKMKQKNWRNSLETVLQKTNINQ